MKKLVTLLAVFSTVMMTQAADLQWDAITLLDIGGAHDDGGIFGGVHYATAGVNLYLVYNGDGGSFNPANWYYNLTGSSLSYSAGSLPGTIVATYTTVSGDYALGNFIQTMSGAALTWLGETSATWEDMNNRSFTIVAISDADGNFASGATWNYISPATVGFSTATGDSGTGFVSAGVFNVSGAGALNVVPEPATALLFGIGGMGAWMVRRNKLKSKEEADA
jgi:hypothetical protein